MQLKVLARNITNLTDARYFASRFVDILAVPWTGSQQNYMLWKALDLWIDGVTWSLQLEHPSPQANIFLREQAIQHCLVRNGPMCELPDEIHQWAQVPSQSPLAAIEEIAENPSVKSVILPLSWFIRNAQHLTSQKLPLWMEINGADDIEKLEKMLIPIEGIVLSGGPEEQTGVKSYDVVDAIFEKIDLSSLRRS